uniref:C-type lectin domain-containing protein n=1 Tax=Steinernema glaseri TaxID=37863 RepID=A0A1I7ZYL6_9BILA
MKRPWILLLNVLLTVLAGDVIVNCGDKTYTNGQKTAGCDCRDGWRPFGGSCYRLFYTPKKWHDAADFCALRGGHLASIVDGDENEFIKNLVVSVGQQISHWIGGFTSVHSTDHLWADGSEWKYSNVIEANTTSPRRCAVANVVLSTAIEWYMDHCDSEWPFICKKIEDSSPECSKLQSQL